MVNREILGGLKLAVERGENLTAAMNSFLNAGYKKAEIEEAARNFKKDNGQTPNKQTQGKTNEEEVQEPQKKSAKKKSASVKKTTKKKSKKRVSNYEGNKKPKGTPKWLIISIIIVSMILVGALIAYFIST